MHHNINWEKKKPIVYFITFEQTWIPFTQGCFVPSLVEIGTVVLKKILKFVNVFSLFRNYPRLERGGALHLKTQGCIVPRLADFINEVSLFGNHLPFEKGWALHLNKLEFPSSKDALCQVWLIFGSMVLKKIFIDVSVFSLFRYYLPLEKGMALHSNKLESPSPKNALCQVWLILVLWFFRRRFLKFVNVFPLFHYYLPLEKGMASIWTNLNLITQECFVPNLVEICPVVLERKMKMWKV